MTNALAHTPSGTLVELRVRDENDEAIVDEFLAPVRGIFEDGDPKTFVDNIFGKGNIVCAETHGKGKLRNGNDYANLYCWVIEIRDDQIYAIREYMDSLYVSKIVQ